MLVPLLFLPFAFVIAVIDLRTHRIPNRLLLLCGLVCVPYRFYISNNEISEIAQSATIIVLISLVLSLGAGVGAGDVKLMALLGIIMIPPSGLGASRFLQGFIFVLTIHFALYLVRNRTIKGSLPLGPSIVIAAIWSAS